MRKSWLAYMVLLTSVSLFSQTVTVTADLKDVFQNPTSTNAKVCFSLIDASGNPIQDPRTSGGVLIATETQCVKPDNTGHISTILTPNDLIVPSNTQYSVQQYYLGQYVHGDNFTFNSTTPTYNLNTATPNSTSSLPVVPQPSSGGTAQRCTFTNAVSTWTCTENMGTTAVMAFFQDANGVQIFPDKSQATDVNTYVGTWLQPQAGSMTVYNVGQWTPSAQFPNYIVANPSAPQTITGQVLHANGGLAVDGDVATTLGGMSATSIDDVRYADRFPGSDIGAQINAAYASLPATGGRIYVGAQASGTCYSFSTPISFATSGKYAVLEGSATSAQAAGGVCLNYTPTTSTTAVTFDVTPTGGGAQAPGVGMRDIFLVNNSCIIAGGCGSNATGIVCGSTNGGCAQAMFENVAVAGFKNGQTISEPSQVGWGITWLNSTFIDDAVGLNYTIAHENDKCIGCSFLLNGTNISLADGSELSLIGGSQDSASTCGVSMIGSAELHATDIHWENLSQTNMQYVCGAPASTLDIHGGSASDDSNSGSTSQNWFTSGFISVDGMQLNSGGRTLTGRVFNVLTRGKVDVINNATGVITSPDAICFIGGVCRVHETANLANTSGVDALGVFGGDEVGAPSSFQNGNQDWCYFDSTSHALMCSYNASAFGVVPLLNRANTWSALQSGSVGAYGQVVASGTATMTTAAIASGACGSTVLVSATGVLTTDSISVAANAAVGTPNGLLTLNYWVTANNVNFAYCNPTASSQTPVAETLNWRVSR